MNKDDILEELSCNNPDCQLSSAIELRDAFIAWGISFVDVYRATLANDPERKYLPIHLLMFFAEDFWGLSEDGHKEALAVVSAFAHFINDQGHIYADSDSCIEHWLWLFDPKRKATSEETWENRAVRCHEEFRKIFNGEPAGRFFN